MMHPLLGRSGPAPAKLCARFLCVGLLTTSCSASSCQSQYGAVSAAPASMAARPHSPTLDDYFGWHGRLVFSDDGSNAVETSFDQHPGFVVADEGQSMVRVYSDDARLLWSVGGSGPGAKEFQRLQTALRNSHGDIIALDFMGKLAVFDSLGNLKRTLQTHLTPAYNAILLDDSTLLIGGRREGDNETALVHVFDLRTDSITHSFFKTPPHPQEFDYAYRFSGWASTVKLGGDTVAVTFALTDSLYLFRTNGERLAALPLGLDHFRVLQEPRPRDRSPEAEIAWRNSYTRLSGVFRAPDHSIYIQYGNLHVRQPVWGLARFELDAHQLVKQFEVPEALLLLGISPRTGNLYFLRDETMENTVWSIGKLLPR